MTDGPHEENHEPEATDHESDAVPPTRDPVETTGPPPIDATAASEAGTPEPPPGDVSGDGQTSSEPGQGEPQAETPPPRDEAPPSSPRPPRSRRPELVRTNGRRVLAGVAAGIGEYLGISPWIPRLGFIFLTPFGGFGPLAYLAAWLLIRREDEADSIAERLWERLSTGQNWLGALLVFIGALVVIASFDFLRPGLVFAAGLMILGVLLYRESIGGPPDPGPAPRPPDPPSEESTMTTASFTPPAEDTSPRPPGGPAQPAATRPRRPARPPRERSPLGRWTVGVALVVVGLMAALDISGAIEPFPRHYTAALLMVVGGGLLVGSIAGRARWLIVPGLILLPVVVTASFVDVPFDRTITVETLRITPDSQADLLDVYDFEAGSFTLDLSEIAFVGADAVEIDMGAGDLTVILPSDLETDVEIRLGVGDIGGVIGSSDGIGLRRTVVLDGTTGPLELDIELGAGEIDVVRGG